MGTIQANCLFIHLQHFVLFLYIFICSGNTETAATILNIMWMHVRTHDDGDDDDDDDENDENNGNVQNDSNTSKFVKTTKFTDTTNFNWKCSLI